MRKKKGVVTSAKMQDTVTVTVHRHAFHPLYKKRFRKSKKFLVDSKGIEDLLEGDTVVITECIPISKKKRFKVTEVVERVPRVSEIKEEEGVEEAIHGERQSTIDTSAEADSQQSTDVEKSSDSSASSASSLSSEALAKEDDSSSK